MRAINLLLRTNSSNETPTRISKGEFFFFFFKSRARKDSKEREKGRKREKKEGDDEKAG